MSKSIDYFAVILLIVFVYFDYGLSEEERDTCYDKLLNNRQNVPDSSFVVSSFEKDYEGKFSRDSLYNEKAWCPKEKIYDRLQEHITIDLGSIHILKMIMTKGLSRHGYKSASYYFIEYKREINQTWIKYRNSTGFRKISGNKDHLTEKFNLFQPSIVARWIKIYPISEEPELICLNLQLYGCIYMNDVLEYQIPQGSIYYSYNYHDVRFTDLFYDGITTESWLKSGLGKLTDGDIIKTNTNVQNPLTEIYFTKSSSYCPFIGWNKNQLNTPHVTINLRFDFRKFIKVRLKTCQWSESEITFPKQINIIISQNQFIHKIAESPNYGCIWIEISLNGAISNFAKIELIFRSTWIILTEIGFVTEKPDRIPSNKSLPNEAEYITKDKQLNQPTKDEEKELPLVKQDGNIQQPAKDYSTTTSNIIQPTHIIKAAPTNNYPITISDIFLTCSISLAILFSFGLCLLCWLRSRRRKSRLRKYKKAALHLRSQEEEYFQAIHTQQKLQNNSNQQQPQHLNSTSPSTTNNLLNNTSYPALTLQPSKPLLNSPKFYSPIFNSKGYTDTCTDKNHLITSTTLPSGSVNSGVYSGGYLHSQAVAPLPSQPQHLQTSSAMIPEAYSYWMYSEVNNDNKSITDLNSVYQDSCKYMSVDQSTTAESLELDIQGVLGNTKLLKVNLINLSSGGDQKINNYQPMQHEINNIASNLTIQETLSTNQNGCIFIGELCNDSADSSYGKKCFTIRKLNSNAPEFIKQMLLYELENLQAINHDNIIRCVRVDNILNMTSQLFLSSSIVLLNDFALDLHTILLNSYMSFDFAQLTNVASQLSSAMTYLESIGLVHRDVACRNLLLMPTTNQNPVIKLSDLAIVQMEFRHHYFSVRQTNGIAHNLIPIRWMPWECMLQEFSAKSDVYSFGICIWELFSRCNQLPFFILSDNQIYQNKLMLSSSTHDTANLICNNQFLTKTCDRTSSSTTLVQQHLEFPIDVPKEIVDIVYQCTQDAPKYRPSFSDIFTFFKYKTQRMSTNTIK